MAYSYARISKRTDPATPFWDFSKEDLERVKALYDDTGRRLSFAVTISEDGLEETRAHVWETIEDWQEYTAVFFDQWAVRDAYYAENNITSHRVEY